MTRHAANMLVCLWGALWTTLAVAEGADSLSLLSLPWIAVLIAGGIAAWGGLVVTLNRITDEMSLKVFGIWLLKDVVSAVVAGWFIFFVGGWAGWNIWFQAVSLLAAGYGGTRVLDAASKRLIKGIKSAGEKT